MAYFTQEMKKEIAPKLKAIAKKYDVKLTLGVRNHSTLMIHVKSGVVDFSEKVGEARQRYTGKKYGYYVNDNATNLLNELNDAAQDGNYDNSDIMTDYFDVGYYVDVQVGKWNKDYIQTN
jgi:hypothetical protein